MLLDINHPSKECFGTLNITGSKSETNRLLLLQALYPWSNEHIMKQVEHHLPLQRAAEPNEIAGLAVYLASNASSYTTGAVLNADGGHMLT